jgi:hypothetical protein
MHRYVHTHAHICTRRWVGQRPGYSTGAREQAVQAHGTATTTINRHTAAWALTGGGGGGGGSGENAALVPLLARSARTGTTGTHLLHEGRDVRRRELLQVGQDVIAVEGLAAQHVQAAVAGVLAHLRARARAGRRRVGARVHLREGG